MAKTDEAASKAESPSEAVEEELLKLQREGEALFRRALLLKQPQDKELATKPVNSIVDAAMGVALAGECVWFSYFNLDISSWNDSLTVAFVASMPVVLAAIITIKKVARAIGGAISSSRWRTSNRVPKDCRNPLSSSIIMNKWEEQSWQLAVHISMATCGAYLLFYGGGGAGSEKWWSDPDTTLNPCPVPAAAGSPLTALRFFYIVQLNIWFVTAVSCKFIEERRKDYVEMMLHHIMTIALVMESLHNGELGIGLVILFIHDASDVVLDVMKMISNHDKREKAA